MSESGFGNGPKKPKMIRKEELRKKQSNLRKQAKPDDDGGWFRVNPLGGGRQYQQSGREFGDNTDDGCMWGCLLAVGGFILFLFLMGIANSLGRY